MAQESDSQTDDESRELLDVQPRGELTHWSENHKTRSRVIKENGDEQDLADSRPSSDREREIRKLVKHIS